LLTTPRDPVGAGAGEGGLVGSRILAILRVNV
jgi:hypothetical protein